MNSENQIKQFIMALGELFPGTVSTAKASIYYQVLKKELSEVDLNKLLIEFADAFKYFPTVKEIKEHLGFKQETRREKAAAFVDTMLSVLQSNHNFYEYVGSDNARFWKETVNITKSDLQQLEPQFHRTHWIDCVERAYLKFDQEQMHKKIANNKAAQLGGKNVEG